ncbi:RNA binding protein, heterogenous nuclear RNP-K like protein [Entophlyctis luteolus]|nr:RNA binding protein, heterogenous nuclear RNP-K like protein [Entophlyctis luteolus]KAJ3340288.1 RNA binding protein, heterogenous nuclear RNP-K like protein [Entophlyctis luteolus]
MSDSLARLTGLTLNPDTIPIEQQTIMLSPASPAPPAAPASAPTPVATTGPSDDDESPQQGSSPSASIVTVRALVTTKEAGVVIGSAGKNVAEIRDATGVKAGVSKVVPGVHERVLSVSGTCIGVAKAFAMIAKFLIESPVPPPMQTQSQLQFPECATVRVLVSHHLIGAVIGKGGAKIKKIQEDSGAKVVVSKDMLPQSTERVVEILGLAKSIEVAVFNVAEIVFNDGKPSVGVIPYVPQAKSNNDNSSSRRTGGRFDDGKDGANGNSSSNYSSNSRQDRRRSSNPAQSSSADEQTQNLNIPSDMVGCIMGKGGSFISNIRRQSGARLRISETSSVDPATGKDERVITVSGTAEAVAKALQLIWEQLDAEKERRVSARGAHDADDDEE